MKALKWLAVPTPLILFVSVWLAFPQADTKFRGNAPEYTWATKPSAASCDGCTIFVPDVGSNDGSASSGVWTPTYVGSFWFSDGSDWYPVGGQVTLCLGKVNQTVTGAVAETQLGSCTVPAGLMGANGEIQISHQWTSPSTTSTKTPRVRFSGGSFATAVAAGCPGSCYYSNSMAAANLSAWFMTHFYNDDATNAQHGQGRTSNGPQGQLSIASESTSVDTTAESYIYFSGDTDSAGDTLTLRQFRVVLYK